MRIQVIAAAMLVGVTVAEGHSCPAAKTPPNDNFRPYPLGPANHAVCPNNSNARINPRGAPGYPRARASRRSQARIGIQIVTPPLPVRGSKVSLWRSKPGASAGVLPLFGNQLFQIAS